MIRVVVLARVLKEFTLGEFDKIHIVKRVCHDMPGHLYPGDEFECDQEMANYLKGDNKYKTAYIEILQIIPEKKKKVDKKK